MVHHQIDAILAHHNRNLGHRGGIVHVAALAALAGLELGKLRPHRRDEQERHHAGQQIDVRHQIQVRCQRSLAASVPGFNGWAHRKLLPLVTEPWPVRSGGKQASRLGHERNEPWARLRIATLALTSATHAGSQDRRNFRKYLRSLSRIARWARLRAHRPWSERAGCPLFERLRNATPSAGRGRRVLARATIPSKWLLKRTPVRRPQRACEAR